LDGRSLRDAGTGATSSPEASARETHAAARHPNHLGAPAATR